MWARAAPGSPARARGVHPPEESVRGPAQFPPDSFSQALAGCAPSAARALAASAGHGGGNRLRHEKHGVETKMPKPRVKVYCIAGAEEAGLAIRQAVSALIREAIGRVRPFAVDACSGLRADGKLDEARLSRFFEQIPI